MSRARPRTALALLALAALCLAGCSDGGSSQPSDGSEPGSAESSEGADGVTDRDRVTSGGRAAEYILGEDELPEGWRLASGEQHLGIPAMCNVVLEPPALESAETQRFTRGYSGPFVIQYSFVSSDEQAAKERIDDFVEAAPTCTEHVVDEDAGRVIDVSEITDIPSVGESFAAVRGTNPQVESNTQDFVVFRNGPAVTVLQAYSPADLPDHDDLAAMAQAIDAKQGS